MNKLPIADQVKSVLEEEIFTNLADVDPQVDLEQDLGIDIDTDLPRIAAKLRSRFKLHADAVDLLQEATTLKQLIDIVKEETELG